MTAKPVAYNDYGVTNKELESSVRQLEPVIEAKVIELLDKGYSRADAGYELTDLVMFTISHVVLDRALERRKQLRKLQNETQTATVAL